MANSSSDEDEAPYEVPFTFITGPFPDLPEMDAIRAARAATDALDVSHTYTVESVRTFLLCRGRESRGSAFGRLPDAVCRSISATGGLFLPAAAFGGSKPGMTFKLGGRGLGYYPDFAALEQAARDAKATPLDRFAAVELQLRADVILAENPSQQVSARAWAGVASRLKELDRMVIGIFEQKTTYAAANTDAYNNETLVQEGIGQTVAKLRLVPDANVAELARALLNKWIVVHNT